jgi:hypothetical protein
MSDILIILIKKNHSIFRPSTFSSCRTAKMQKNVNSENNLKSQCHEFFPAVFQQLKTSDAEISLFKTLRKCAEILGFLFVNDTGDKKLRCR